MNAIKMALPMAAILVPTPSIKATPPSSSASMKKMSAQPIESGPDDAIYVNSPPVWLPLVPNSSRPNVGDPPLDHRGVAHVINARLGDALTASAGCAIETSFDIIDRADGIGLPVRAAVHAAEVEHLDGDVLGLGVMVAARVLAHAKGSEVLTTSSVADLLIRAGFHFASRGTVELKGIPRPIELNVVRRR